MGANTTQNGRGYHAKHDDFWYFDRLPPTARNALAEAAFNWSSGAVYNRWQRGKPGYKTGKDIAVLIKQWDRATIKKEDRKK